MRILIAVDGSQPSQVARDLAAAIDWPEGSSLRVMAALEIGGALFGAPWYAVAPADVDELEERYLHEFEAITGDAAARLAAPGRSVDAVVVRGRAATSIVDEARHFGADLIVVGSRGHGTLESMLLGSVSAEVVDHAPCPVLVARRPRLASLLLADDGSAGARAACEKVVHWPIFGGLEVRVVSVAPASAPWQPAFPVTYGPTDGPAFRDRQDAAIEAHQRLVDDTARRLELAGCKPVTDVRAGDAAREIVAAARDTDVDLIVTGTRGHTGLARLVLGSVARNVVHHAACSVLIVPERTRTTVLRPADPPLVGAAGNGDRS
ncbi:MAG: universal stress protein [Candidatus Limnocylindrales bacterium]